MKTLLDQITLATPAKLIRGDHVTQFGEGYRQVMGSTTVAEGTVGELMKQVRSMSPSEIDKIFFNIENVMNNWTIEEVANALRD